ncbi:PilZ domain-containing protein [Sphingomonas fennica]|nr:PilZ domain-containing protein [Sphingomonas fennica]
MSEATRRSMRHDVIAQAILHVAGEAPMAATLCNISRHGMVIDSLASLSSHSDIRIELIEGQLLPARLIWREGFKAGLELVEPLRANDYWPLLVALATDDASASDAC